MIWTHGSGSHSHTHTLCSLHRVHCDWFDELSLSLSLAFYFSSSLLKRRGKPGFLQTIFFSFSLKKTTLSQLLLILHWSTFPLRLSVISLHLFFPSLNRFAWVSLYDFPFILRVLCPVFWFWFIFYFISFDLGFFFFLFFLFSNAIYPACSA